MCLRLSECCCCISLGAGVKIIAIFSIIISSLTVGFYGTLALMLPSQPHQHTAKIMFYGVLAFVGAYQLLLSFLLTFGAFKKRASLLRPWVVLNWAWCMVLASVCVAGMVMVTINAGYEEIAAKSYIISFYFIYSVILYYLTSVVDSYRVELLQDTSESAKRLMTGPNTVA